MDKRLLVWRASFSVSTVFFATPFVRRLSLQIRGCPHDLQRVGEGDPACAMKRTTVEIDLSTGKAVRVVCANLCNRLGRWRLGRRVVCRPVKAAQRTRRGPDCRLSSGGTVQDAKIPVAKGDQLPFAQRIREEADERTIA